MQAYCGKVGDKLVKKKKELKKVKTACNVWMWVCGIIAVACVAAVIGAVVCAGVHITVTTAVYVGVGAVLGAAVGLAGNRYSSKQIAKT